MSNNREQYWDEEEDDDLEDGLPTYQTETDLVKKLRRDLKVAQKRNKELESSYAELSKSQKERIIKDVLTSRGVNPKIADIIPSNVEVNPDSVNAWLDSMSDALNLAKEDKPTIAPQDVNAIKKMDAALAGADASTVDSIEALIAGAESEADILSLIRGQ